MTSVQARCDVARSPVRGPQPQKTLAAIGRDYRYRAAGPRSKYVPDQCPNTAPHGTLFALTFLAGAFLAGSFFEPRGGRTCAPVTTRTVRNSNCTTEISRKRS